MIAATSEQTSACFAVECRTCGLTTWQGCGKHIDQVMSAIPKAEQCKCPRK